MSGLEEIKEEMQWESPEKHDLFWNECIDEQDMDYLIKQAERVEELVNENETLAETRKLDAEQNVSLWEKSQRYKQALTNTLDNLDFPETVAKIIIEALKEAE